MGDTGGSPEKVVAQCHQEAQLPACSNALAETINGLYKAEIIHRRGPWKTREAVELATLEWVSWFNHHRLLEPIGYIPPAEAEAHYWRQQGQAAVTTKPAQPAAPQEG